MSSKDEILRQLESDDMEVVREGAFLAGEERCEEAVPLLTQHVHSSNLGVQEAADMALRRIGGSVTVHAVIPLLSSDDAPARNIGMDILREVGKEDFPTLVELLHDNDADIRIFISDILGSTDNVMAVQPLCEALLKDPEVNVRYQAAVSLGNLAFKEAAGCLNKAMADEEWVQFAVIEALTKVRDESSVGALANALSHSSDLVASMIVDAMGEMGNIKAVAILLKHMDDAPTPLRNKIVKAIVNLMGGKSLTLLSEKERETFREYLVIALQDEDEEVQDAAMHGLSYVGGEFATKGILGIAAQLNPDTDHDRLQMAVDCIAAIGLNTALEEAVRGDESIFSALAVESISRMADSSAQGLLMEVFWTKDRDTQRDLAHALVRVGDEEAKEFFLDVLGRHSDGTVLKDALEFLGRATSPGEDTDAVFAMLEHPFNDVKEAALEACISIGGEELSGRIEALYENEDPIQRMMAVYAMGRLGTAGALEKLKSALEDEVPDIRKIALESLESVCREDMLELLAPRLSDENRDVRLTVVNLLGGCTEPGAVDHLLQALADEDDWVRIRAVEALGSLREHNAIVPLIELMANDNKLLVIKVMEALGQIGGKTAFRALMGVADSDDPELQGAAEDAIARIQEEQGE